MCIIFSTSAACIREMHGQGVSSLCKSLVRLFFNCFSPKTCIKDTWTKPKRVGSRVAGREGGWGGRGGVKMEATVLEQ